MILGLLGGPAAAEPAPTPDPTTPDATAPDAATTALVQRIQKTYAPVDTLAASFVQVTESGLYGREEQSGELALRRPNLMRWDFAGSGKQYVLDGKSLWVYLPAQKQVQKYSSILQQSMIANNLLMSLHKVGEDFEASALPAESGHRLALTPKDPTLRSQVKSIVLSVDDAYALSGLKLVDPVDNVTLLTFRETRLGADVPAGTFTFEVPEGVEVIDAG